MTFPPLCLSCTAILRENFGGARRNRTADKGFADLCLTTWRPRHRMRAGRVRPGDSGLLRPVPCSVLHLQTFLAPAKKSPDENKLQNPRPHNPRVGHPQTFLALVKNSPDEKVSKTHGSKDPPLQEFSGRRRIGRASCRERV